MPKFHYTAKNKDDKNIEGTEEARDTAALLQKLAQKELTPISVKVLKGQDVLSKDKKLFKKKITLTDQIFLTKYISIMLKVGTDLFQAINILIADFKKPALKSLLLEVRQALEKGQPFYSTFAKYPRYFSPVFINLVKSGESSGTLESVFDDINLQLTKQKELRSKIKGALIYPSILIGLSFLILLFLMTFALPRLAAIFTGGGFEPPLFSKVVFTIGLFIDAHIVLILIALALIFVGFIFLIKSDTGRKAFARMRTRLPIIKRISYDISLQRFASTLSSLLKAGLPIIDALDITADTVDHPEMEASIKRAKENVIKGVSLGDAFRQESSFPLVVTNLIAISEKAGHIDEILQTLADFYTSEIDASLKRAVSLIEPVLLPVIGAIIGTIAVAVIIPVYQLVGQL